MSELEKCIGVDVEGVVGLNISLTLPYPGTSRGHCY